MRLFSFLISFLFLTTYCSGASRIEAGFEALRIYDYFKAKRLFEKELHKKTSKAAALGLSHIFYRKDNPFSNIDSAAKYISLAAYYLKMNPNIEIYSGFKIDSVNIYLMVDSISAKYYERTLMINSVLAYEHFIVSNPFCSSTYLRHALKKRDQQVLNKIQSINKSDSTLFYILRYPQSFYYSDLITNYQKQVFEENTTKKSEQEYIRFIHKFPSNKFIREAQNALFTIYKNENNISGLENFIKNYPNSMNYFDAWKLLYALSVTTFNNEELLSFMSRYPNFPFKESINKDIELNNKILIPLNDSDFVGFIDTSGRFIIQPIFDAASTFKEGLAVVIKNDSTYFINKENQNIFGAIYSEAYPFHNGVAPINKNGQWFLINRQGQTIAGSFDDLSEQSDLLYVIKKNNKYGALNTFGQVVIEPQFERLGDFKNGKAYYQENGFFGFIDKTGHVYKAKYQWISAFDENDLAIIKLNNYYGIINQNDSLILSPKYDLIIKADLSTYILVKDGKFGYFHSKACFISDIDNDFTNELSPSYYTNGTYFKLNKSKKEAIRDVNGKIIIDFGAYDEIDFAGKFYFKVKKKDKIGMIDKKNSVIIPIKYSSISSIHGELVICQLKNSMILMNLKNEVIFKTEGVLTSINHSYYWLELEEVSQLIDKKGKLLFDQVIGYQITEFKNSDHPGKYLILEFENKSKKIIKL